MPPSTQPVSSNIVLPPITAFDHPSRDAPVYSLNRPSQYQYLPYPPQVPSSSSVEPRATYQGNLPNYQAARQIWPSQQYSLPQQARAPPQDHNLLLAQQPQERSNFKEVKRRTKTGCQTCRKRRIKVSFRAYCSCMRDCSRPVPSRRGVRETQARTCQTLFQQISAAGKSPLPHASKHARTAWMLLVANYFPDYSLLTNADKHLPNSATKPGLPAEIVSRAKEPVKATTLLSKSAKPILPCSLYPGRIRTTNTRCRLPQVNRNPIFSIAPLPSQAAPLRLPRSLSTSVTQTRSFHHYAYIRQVGWTIPTPRNKSIPTGLCHHRISP